MAAPRPVLLDDRLLIEELLVGLRRRGTASLFTTTYWYYRACRAAVAGAGGQLSGPFERLGVDEQQRAVLGLLELRDDIGLAESRACVPVMADVARRHPRLNLLNVEAVAAAELLGATVWLSPPAAQGLLVDALDRERVRWRTIAPR
jgi:hypothetical protein